jgi:hypothetical protein
MAALAPVAALGLGVYTLPKLTDWLSKPTEPGINADMPHESRVQNEFLYQELPYSGLVAGQWAQLTNQFEYPTYKPLPSVHTVGHPNGSQNNLGVDSMREMFDEHMKLKQYSHDRLRFKLNHEKGIVVTKRLRGWADPLTREIRHPNTGESTGFIDYAFMPKDPTDRQKQQAQVYATRYSESVARRRRGQDKWHAAPGQSFRYQPRKG